MIKTLVKRFLAARSRPNKLTLVQIAALEGPKVYRAAEVALLVATALRGCGCCRRPLTPEDTYFTTTDVLMCGDCAEIVGFSTVLEFRAWEQKILNQP